MKRTYITPSFGVEELTAASLLCGSPTDKASIGGSGSSNEQNQDDISTGGPGVSGASGRRFGEEEWD